MKPAVNYNELYSEQGAGGGGGLLTDRDAEAGAGGGSATGRSAETLVGYGGGVGGGEGGASPRSGGGGGGGGGGAMSPRSGAGAGAGGHTARSSALGRTAPAPSAEPYVTRYGFVSARGPTHAVPFGNAKRNTQQSVGSAATVPFHYLPPAFDEKNPSADVKNAGSVPFTTSTRDQWSNVHQRAQSSATAGPGAYDVERADPHLAGRKVCQGVSFPMSEREVLKPFVTPGPQDYRGSEQLENYLLRQLPRPAMGRSGRATGVKPAVGPAPFDTRAAYEATMGRHSAEYKFSGAPAHEKPLVNDVATASVPFYGGERMPRRPVVGMPFTRAKRVL